VALWALLRKNGRTLMAICTHLKANESAEAMDLRRQQVKDLTKVLKSYN